ncbi:MAG: RHS repeat-associated core domain-containing protein [Limisphaerales bacterium]
MKNQFSLVIGKPLKACLQAILIAGCLLADGVAVAQSSAETAAQRVMRQPLFPDALVWIGSQPTEAESQALLGDINAFSTEGIGPGFAALSRFVDDYPRSGWTPDLQIHLAEYDRARGRYIEALGYWQAAWDETRDGKEAKARKLAVRAIAGWTRLLASLGRKDQLEKLFAELSSRHLPLGTYATEIEETKEGLATMRTEPGRSYRCGSYALGHLARALHASQTVINRLFMTDSPNGGFTISELLALARTNGLDVEAVRRPPGAPLVVPCIVHWKLNHYAAITMEKNGRYLVDDPTFERSVWMDAPTIDAEASGDFILPKSKVPVSWRKLGKLACSRIYGKGNPAIFNDPNDTGCGGNGTGNGGGGADGPGGMSAPMDTMESGGGSDGSGDGGPGSVDVSPVYAQPGGSSGSACGCGMPQWSVSEPYENLWLKDTPLLYQQSDLSWERLNVSYKQRGAAQASTVCGFGNNWSCTWIDVLQQQSTPESDTFTEFPGSGGQMYISSVGAPNYQTGDVLAWVVPAQPQSGPPLLVAPNGATNIYGFAQAYSGGTTNYFLTQQVDQFGRTVQQFNYKMVGDIVELASVVDFDGQTNTLAYGDASFPNLITSVTDRYGRTAYFNYDSNGDLTNVVDADGMSSYFEYDDNYEVTNMITPYGTNSFQISDTVDTDNSDAPARAILITEADGDHQLYEHNSDSSDPTVDPDTSSYHWNRKQYEAISAEGKANVFSLTSSDYELASAKIFLYDSDNDGYTLGNTIAWRADPVNPFYNQPDPQRTGQVQYQYDGSGGDVIGPLRRLTLISGSGTAEMAYNDVGNLTNYIYFNSDNSQASYTNYYDPSGRILLYEIGPMGELVFGCGCSASVPALVTSVTNALGEVTRYTYDSHLRLTSVTFPGGLVRTNIYYTSGPETGFLAQEIDCGFRTNSFLWQDGNLIALTNALGLVTDYTYDNLNRLTSIGYPDGTTISNVYNRLDIVATKDRLNQWTYYGFNQVRQLMAMTNADGQVTTYDYCGCGSPDEIIHWDGSWPLTTQIAYDMAGLVTNVIYPDGYSLDYAYDVNDRPQMITFAAGYQESLSWYQHGLNGEIQVLSFGTVYGSQQLYSCQFDQYGRVYQSTDRNGITTTNAFDFLNRRIARQSFGGESQQTGLETFEFGPLGLTNYVDQLGHVTAYLLNQEGQTVAETNANNEVLRFSYNPANEMLSLTDGKGETTTWGYDQYGLVTNKMDASGITDFTYSYDADNRLTSRWTPAKGTTVYRYDPLGNLTNVDYSGGTTYTPSLRFAYDFLNRLTNMVDGIGATAFTWTPGNQLAGETGPWPDDAVSYTYNSVRQRSVISLLQPNAGPWTQTYTYDYLMRLSALMSPAGGNFASPVGVFSYDYSSALEQPYQVNMPPAPNSEPHIYNGYDGMARKTESEAWVNYGEHFWYSYDEGSEVTQQVFAAGNYINFAYDKIGQLTAAQGFEQNNTPRLQEQFGYAYDDAWNLSERTNNALIQSFTVNDLNELSGASQSGTLTVGGSMTESPVSPNGGTGVTNLVVNLESADVYEDGSFAAPGFTPATGLNTYTAIAQDNIGRASTNSVTVNVVGDRSYTYDANGNLTSDGARNFAYNDENQLVGVWSANSWSNSFAYDGLMRKRIERDFAWNGSGWTQTNEILYVYDGNLVLQERDGNDEPLTTYTRGIDLSGTLQGAGGIGGLLARSDNQRIVPAILCPEKPNPQNVVTTYYFSDAQGNVVELFAPNGMILAHYKYDPFGNLISKNGLMADMNKFRFSSKEWEGNAGLYYYGYRFYDPGLQRWVNRDPIEDSGFLDIAFALPLYFPRELADGGSLYTFLDNAAPNQVDLSGLWHFGWPPWGPPPKPPKPPPPPPPPGRCPKPPPTPCDDWKSDKPGPAKQADCSLCCEQQFIEDEAKHPDEGIKNKLKEEACNGQCLLSNGDKGPK